MTPREYFEQNPEANTCYEALGYIRGTKEEAEALVGGTKATFVVHEREQVAVQNTKKGGNKK